MSDSEAYNSDTEMAPPPAAKRPSSPSTSDRSSKSQRMQTEPKQEEQQEDEETENAQQAGSTLSAAAPAFVPSAPSASAPKIPAKIEANVHKLIAAGLSDATINARLASTAATHGLRPYQFNKSQLALARANFEALKRGALGAKLGGNLTETDAVAGSSSSSTSTDTRPVKPIPAKPLSMRAGAKTYLPEQAKVPKTKEEKENSRRLIVVLSKVGHQRLDLFMVFSSKSVRNLKYSTILIRHVVPHPLSF
jgi:hypothetical protein